MSDDIWAALAGQFVDQAYASVKGYVRTYVLHRQLSRVFHLLCRKRSA